MKNKSLKLSESMCEKIGIGTAILTAALFAYATFPAIMNLIMPSAPTLWKPLLSTNQGLTIIGGIIAIMLLLTIVNRLRLSRATGNSVIPVFVWVILFGLLAAAITALVVIVAFGVTFQTMLDIGLDSSAALIIGLTVSFLVWRIFSKN